jgi:hypothetical protein
MKKISESKRKIWIGSHSHIGLFIYDEETQGNLDDKKIRIFKFKQWAASTFIKTKFKSGISDVTIGINAEVLKQINKYEQMWAKGSGSWRIEVLERLNDARMNCKEMNDCRFAWSRYSPLLGLIFSKVEC